MAMPVLYRQSVETAGDDRVEYCDKETKLCGGTDPGSTKEKGELILKSRDAVCQKLMKEIY